MPAFGLAVFHRDDRILRDVDQTARQITRIRGLQRGVGQTLAGAVRRVEVLEHRETFLEVGDDRALDDLARGLRHQAAHAGKLLHLRGRTARAGVRHHVDRVDRNLAAGLLVLLHRGNFLHHRVGDAIGALRPGVDHLVVLLALGDQAVLILLLVLLGERAGLLDHFPLRVRHHHVVLAERNAGLERVVEAERHDAVAEDHCLLLPAVAVDGVDHSGDFALGHQLVRGVERNLGRARQHLAEHHAARRGVVPAPNFLAVLVQPLPAILDLGVERDRLLIQRMLDVRHGAEQHALRRARCRA